MSDSSSLKTAAANNYQVRIRSANQKVDDYITTCSPSWTVLNLKEQIAKTHVNKPNVEGQRLIYAGNVLKDSNTLEQIFFRDSLCTELTNFNKKDFTIHMVCQNKPPTRSSPVPGTSTTNATSAGSPPQSSTQTNPSHQQANRSTTSTLFGPSTTLPSNVASPDQQYIRNFMQSDQMRQQMATFQQLACLVAAQIAENLARGNQGTLRNNSDPITTPPINSTIPVSASSLSGPPLNVQINAQVNSGSHPNENPQNVLRQLAEARQVGLNQIQPAQAVYAPNPQPQVNVDPMQQHDVIDWVYYSVRAFLLIVALYLHASAFRLLLLMGLLLVAYFFNRRSGRRNYGQNNHQQIHQPRQNPPAAPLNVQEDAELRRRNVEGRANANHNVNNNNTNADVQGESHTSRVQSPPAPNRLPFLKLCCLVVADFVTSLLPQ